MLNKMYYLCTLIAKKINITYKMRTSIILVSALTSLMLMTTGCSLTKKGVKANPVEKTTTGTVVSENLADNLLGKWSVINVDEKDVTVSDDQYPTVSFDTNGAPAGTVNIYAYNGCNFINGSYKINGNQLKMVGDFAATMKYCPDAVYEIPITMALNEMKQYSIEKINNEYYLYLKNDAGTTLMTCRKHNLGFFDGAWRVTKIQGVQLSEENAPEIVVDLAEGKIHGNAGCNVLNGTVTQNLDHEGGIGFTNLFTTRMTCPDIAIEQAFILALEQIETCVPGSNNDTALLKDANGQTIITLQRINLK